MHLAVTRVDDDEISEIRRTSGDVVAARSWKDIKESIYGLHRRMFASTKNRFLERIMNSILDERSIPIFCKGVDTGSYGFRY
jgi:DNA-binding FadR family transcriptional regulator